MKVQELDPQEVEFTPVALAARTYDEKELRQIRQDIAESYVKRREAGQVHQVQPGIVRSVDNKFQVVDGNNRLAACRIANEALANGEDKYLYLALVFREGDDAALITAIQANDKRKPSSLFDRADTMVRLLAMGKTQDQIADIYGLDKSTVSQTLAAGKLPAKLKKMVTNGDFEPDAALLVATIDDTTARQEVIDECIRHRNFFDEFETRNAEEKEAEAKPKKNGKKEAEPEAPAEATEEAAPSKSKKSAKKKTAPSKVTKEDVARTARSVPAAQKSAAAATSAKLSDKKFFAILEALYKDADKPLPKSAKAIISAVEALKDGDIGADAFRNRLLKNCTAD